MIPPKNRLELTWINKEVKPRLEPRILLEEEALSYCAPTKKQGDIFDNMLIEGDNLLALKSLEQHYTGKVKCIYIDPPFNTGSAFEHYDDGVEHSLWLGLMRDRLELLYRLLCKDGVFIIHLDDSEMAYSKILLDEIFGRINYCNTITMTTNDPSGFKATAATLFSTANYLLIYAKDKTTKPLKKTFVEKSYDAAYNMVLINRDEPYTSWKWCGIREIVAEKLGFSDVRAAKVALKDSFNEQIATHAIANPFSIFRLAVIGGGAKIKRKETIKQSQFQRDTIFVHPGENIEGFYILNGQQMLFYNKRFVEIDGKHVPGEVITDVWTDISWNGIAREGEVKFKNGKKPEALIQRVLEISTNPGDLVLDSFLGSGTTAAVTHKMRRRWIGIELGEHCQTHCQPRLKKVINGEDQGGITRAVGWEGGGGFRYYKLAPSLLEKDKHGFWIINKEYNAAMLAEALCKIEGFIYSPNENVYWQQGYSTETDYIYVTTQHLTVHRLAELSEEVGEGRSLLVLCTSFSIEKQVFANLTVKKIPNSVLSKCEWGHDDYSLKVENLPQSQKKPTQQALAFEEEGTSK